MQYTTLSVALFAALASASQRAPHHFHLRRAYNDTLPSTTLIVYTTEVQTITSCAATITDCPARPEEQTSEYLITQTRALTTVCEIQGTLLKIGVLCSRAVELGSRGLLEFG